MRKVGWLILGAASLIAVNAPPAEARKWGVGIRSTSQSIVSEANVDEELQLEGGGIHIRYRLSQRWELELASEHVTAELGGGSFVRDSAPVTLSVLWHLTPQRSWDWYLIGGLGGTVDKASYRKVDGTTVEEVVDQSHVHFGVGLQKALGPIVLGAELRALGLSQEEESAATTSVIPVESSGSQLNLVATYYF
jgi:hypothetical protein